jgi:integrase
MRIEEIYRLTVRDCKDGWFIIGRAKTAAGVRRVPIHSAFAGLVARRSQGKPGAAFLFHEVGPLRLEGVMNLRRV